jgi:hypothetical protein
MLRFARIEAPPLTHSSPDCAQTAPEKLRIKSGKRVFINPHFSLALRRSLDSEVDLLFFREGSRSRSV